MFVFTKTAASSFCGFLYTIEIYIYGLFQQVIPNKIKDGVEFCNGDNYETAIFAVTLIFNKKIDPQCQSDLGEIKWHDTCEL